MGGSLALGAIISADIVLLLDISHSPCETGHDRTSRRFDNVCGAWWSCGKAWDFLPRGPGFKTTCCRFETGAILFTPRCPCLPEETLKYHTQGIGKKLSLPHGAGDVCLCLYLILASKHGHNDSANCRSRISSLQHLKEALGADF